MIIQIVDLHLLSRVFEAKIEYAKKSNFTEYI